MMAFFCFFDFGAYFLNSFFNFLIFFWSSLSVIAYFVVNAFIIAIVRFVSILI